MGELLRRYWQPALLSWELDEEDGAPLRVRLLCEDLIAFRDTEGNVGLLDALCPHRRAPLFYGRNEECGLRCVYHGWKFDTDGNCVDTPAEPADSQMREKVRIKHYPIIEKAGVIWAYMGPPGHMPPPPDYEWMRAPSTHRFVSKNYQECNYLQGLEGGLDTSHTTYLHNNVLGNKKWTTRNSDGAPQIEVFPAEYGYSYISTRKLDGDRRYIRAYQYVMPFQQMRGDITGDDGERNKVPIMVGHFWMPIDDTQTYTWNWIYGYDETAPITPEFAAADEIRAGRGPDDLIPGTFRPKRNLSNDHMIDRELQKTATFTGITGVGTQDSAVQEAMGPIVDRSREYLGASDKAIIAMRKMLLEATYAIERGEEAPGIDPKSHGNVRPYDAVVPAGVDWREAFADELVAKW
jgi:phenylpropionate dioxygenase-like ring-hydroxylating dioxygenase large terminal subunit